MAANKDWSCPEWITEALQTLRPPGRMTVSEWADARRVLDAKTSSMPGRWSTDQTPYLREIMDAFNDPEIEEISLMKSTQIGGTEAMLNMLGYVIDQDPSASMIVYPTKELGEFSSKNRIQTMVDLCPELREKYDAGSKLLELQFSEMYLVISGANSPATLASYPIRYLFMDEVDKYPENAGKEADPRALARERTNSYRDNRKIISVSTPTYEDGNIYKDWLAADEQNEYWVTCPECGAQWSWEFKQLKFDNSSPEMAQQTAMYCCKECGAMLSDAQHNRMNQQGFWKKVKSSGRQRVAFRMNVFASPFIRLGDSLRRRIMLAPHSFSSAGAAKSYEYWARTADPAVADAKAASPSAGVVNVTVLMDGGKIPTAAQLKAVENVLSAQTVRPLGIQVNVVAAEAVSYTATAKYYISSDDTAEINAIKSRVESAYADYLVWQKAVLGRAINPDELRRRLLTAGANRVDLSSPQWTTLDDDQVAAESTSSALTYGGTL